MKSRAAMMLAVIGCALSLMTAGCGPTPPEASEEQPPPATTHVDETEPADVAAAALTAYCTVDREQEEWKAGLLPYLSDRGRRVYANTDVSQISECTVNEPVGDPEADGNLLQYVIIDTDAGEWLVTVSKAGNGAPWRVDAFTPPPEPGGTQPVHTDNSQPDY